MKIKRFNDLFEAKKKPILEWDPAEGSDETDWEFFVDGLKELMGKETQFYVEGRKMGWQGGSGFTTVDTDKPEEFLENILPKTQNYSLEFFKSDDKDAMFDMKVYHHDAPMGEERTVYAMDKAVKKGLIKDEDVEESRISEEKSEDIRVFKVKKENYTIADVRKAIKDGRLITVSDATFDGDQRRRPKRNPDAPLELSPEEVEEDGTIWAVDKEVNQYKTWLKDIIDIDEALKNDEEGDWKEKLQRAYTEIWKTMMYPMKMKGKPKADDILKREFPFLK